MPEPSILPRAVTNSRKRDNREPQISCDVHVSDSVRPYLRLRSWYSQSQHRRACSAMSVYFPPRYPAPNSPLRDLTVGYTLLAPYTINGASIPPRLPSFTPNQPSPHPSNTFHLLSFHPRPAADASHARSVDHLPKAHHHICRPPSARAVISRPRPGAREFISCQKCKKSRGIKTEVGFRVPGTVRIAWSSSSF